ncbi:MAG: hypothetical protein AB1673_10635 [Actinomycetota bacterium]|jgi:hypothetical protein
MSARPEAPNPSSLPGTNPSATLRVALALAVAALVLTGCRDKSAPDTVVPAGFVAVRDADAGFAMGVPAEWLQIPLPRNLDVFNEESRKLLAVNTDLLPAINQARQVLQYGGKLMAVSADGRSRVNLTIDKAQEKDLEEIARLAVPLLEEGGATNVRQEPGTTGAGPALKLTFNYPLPARGDTVEIADEVQYYVLHKGNSVVITVINGSAELAQTIADTLRLR